MRSTAIIILLAFVGLLACKQGKQKAASSGKIKITEVIKDDYQLYMPSKEVRAVLILFGGYPESADDIKREFKIIDSAGENGIAVLLSNFNQKLWLDEIEKHQLSNRLQEVIVDYKLPKDKIYIGGFSSGGVISLLISNFIAGSRQYHINPKGVFAVDSPIDLEALYHSSVKNIERNYSKPAIHESTWLVENLYNDIGDPKDDIKRYEDKAVFTYSTDNITNLKNLQQTKIRFYTEPDTLWWKEKRMAEYEQMNAFYIKKLYESLMKKGFENVEYIPTFDKGYRASGERHPHSWSIVDKKELLRWVLSE